MRLDRNITHEVYGVYLTLDGSVALDGWSITRECTATVYKHPKILIVQSTQSINLHIIPCKMMHCTLGSCGMLSFRGSFSIYGN